MSLCGEARTTDGMFVHIVFAHIQVGARSLKLFIFGSRNFYLKKQNKNKANRITNRFTMHRYVFITSLITVPAAIGCYWCSLAC